MGEVENDQATQDPADHGEGLDFILHEWSATLLGRKLMQSHYNDMNISFTTVQRMNNRQAREESGSQLRGWLVY